MFKWNNVIRTERLAEITVNKYNSAKLQAEIGTTVPCYVIGFFQYRDGDEAGVIALVELKNGAIVEETPTRIRFYRKEVNKC